MVKVSDILEHKGRDVAVISKEATVVEAARMMHARHIGGLVVTERNTPIGIFTERDLMNRVVAADRDVRTTRVADVMTSPIATVRTDTPLDECQRLMTNMRLRHLPVVEDGALLGIISSGDIMAWRMSSCEHAVEHLSEYLYGRT